MKIARNEGRNFLGTGKVSK